MSGRKRRRSWSASENLRIVLSELDGSIEISELCRREGSNPTQYYGWKKQRMNSASQEFGFRQPIVVDTEDVIVCGHTRWKAAQLGAVPEQLVEKVLHSFLPKNGRLPFRSDGAGDKRPSSSSPSYHRGRCNVTSPSPL